ncbi:MAG: TIGR03619 family F420-dependent LLM class oxidoreductase [Acidimicrobiales bacterium]
MRIGMATYFGTTPRRDFGFVRDFAVATEELGYRTLYAPEHVVFFPSYTSRYPYSADGKPNWGPDAGAYDPLFVCAAAALATTTLRLSTSVLILPERPALLVAKEVMTLDHLSEGRFELGVGIGWSSEEYAALGVPFERRGRRADEYLEAIRLAWTQERATYHGEFVSFEDAVLNPKPRHGTVPILVGGDSAGAMRRAARLGDGWFGWWASGELEPHLAELRAIMAAEGRAHDAGFSLRVGLPIAGTDYDEVAAKAAEAARLGVDEFVLGPAVPTRGFDGHLRRWAEAVSLR